MKGQEVACETAGTYKGRPWPSRRCQWKVDLPGDIREGVFSCACLPENVTMFESGGRTCGMCLIEQDIRGVVPVPGQFRTYAPVLYSRYENVLEIIDSNNRKKAHRGFGDTVEFAIYWILSSRFGTYSGMKKFFVWTGHWKHKRPCQGGCTACKIRQAWLNLVFPYSKFVWKLRWRRFSARLWHRAPD